jgi:hypothetical protein
MFNFITRQLRLQMRTTVFSFLVRSSSLASDEPDACTEHLVVSERTIAHPDALVFMRPIRTTLTRKEQVPWNDEHALDLQSPIQLLCADRQVAKPHPQEDAPLGSVDQHPVPRT